MRKICSPDRKCLFGNERRMGRYTKEIENLYTKHGICKTIPTSLTSIAQALGYVVKYFLLTAENRYISGVTFYKKKEILINALPTRSR